VLQGRQEVWAEQGPLADFPRGAAAGDCLHRILERLDYRQEPGAPDNLPVVEAELGRAGLGDQPLAPLLDGLARVLQTPCGGALGGFRLGELEVERRINEMAFDLCLDRVRATDLAAVFREHPDGSLGQAYAERLEALPVDCRGYLTGSIDLVCRAVGSGGEERWWVVDWKSNWLGRRDGEGRPLACGPSHYDQRTMAEVMVSHHYPLQAHLYLVALHRYLLWRWPGYAPERDLGGYAYVFLRGTPGPEAAKALPGAVPGMVVEQPPAGRVLALHRALGGVT
jgi:exodeoxyribonuclease V beta subunit